MGQRAQRLSLVSFGGLVLLSAGLAGLIHRVSPLRDPNFEMNSANAGTLVPWLRWVSENTWLWTSFALAVLLAVSLTWVLRQWSQAPTRTGQRGRWIAIAAVLFLALGFTSYTVAYSSSNYGSIGPVKLAAAIGLPALLTIHFTGMIWFWQRIKTALAQDSEPAPAVQRWGQLYTSVYWAGFAASLFTALQVLFLGYLFAQHMVD
jgi:heme/copper-type cytochrome/quinol oxidase subunit 2